MSLFLTLLPLLCPLLSAEGAVTLFPFGPEVQDGIIYRNDDHASITLIPSVPFIFFGRELPTIYVSIARKYWL